jgi:SAM-dependent methyltransferase
MSRGQRVTGANACVCGGTTYEIVLTGVSNRLGLDAHAFTVGRCVRCSLARTLDVPDPEQYHDGFALTTHDGAFSGSTSDAYSARLARYVADRTRGPRFLDVGCHAGALVAAARELGLDAEGIDLDPFAVAAGAELGRTLRTIGIEDVEGPYDAVVMSHVLEHVVDLSTFLTHAARLLSPRGRLFVFVPHYRGLLPRLMGDRWMGWFPSQHVWHFTPPTLSRTVAAVSPLHVVARTTTGVIEPPSPGAKGRAKAVLAAVSRLTHRGDQIEAILERRP